ncbi:MAG: Stk1 family PASTA domain-containing Ser/Thr kinase [Clostridia bacterium]|nr:Stk1 family PASTA domain-containing Ser/Thr kinase [Clostridia bacterium]MBQ3006858.1 Stk1 family PASTA domain-containing Ser/Thr kinase [Clostridia bacterium]
MDNYTGKRLDGRYEIQEVIGVGGMAVVYKAYDNIDDRTVAVKILKDEYLANEEFRRRFKNESKAIAVLSHPNIVKVFNVSYGDRLQYIVMEHVEGITLKEYIEQQGRLGIKETVHFTIQILRALQHAHDKGIVHRDIKPQNIMLLSNGNIKVTDFGIARFSYSDTKTMTDSAIGSVHYISPEQARGDSTDSRADIYSVGVVMYEMLTGQLPFQSDNSVSVALMQLQSDPTKPRELNSSIPVGLEQIVMHAMQKNNKDRYQSAAEMLLDIEEFKRNPTIRFQRDYFVDTDPTKFVPKKGVVSQPAIKTPSHSAVQPQMPVYDEYDDEDDEPKKSKGGLIAIGVIIGLLVISILGFAFMYFFTDVFTGEMVTVPKFVGYNYETDIKDNPEYRNFRFEISTISNSAYENGTVFDQEPDSGQKMSKDNNVVQLAIVQNEQKVVIPSVVGLGYEPAKQTLENKGLTVKLAPMLSLTEEFGTVIKTDPEADTEVDSGSVIIVYYASTDELVEVPAIANVGFDTETARLFLESVQLVMDTEIKEENSNEPLGTVIAQSPEAGEKVMPNSKVTITISNGIPESSEATLNINLPASGSSGKFEVYVSNEPLITKSLLLDGSPYTFTIEGSGENVSVKIYIDNKEYYTCVVDFTKDPAVVSQGTYSSQSPIVNTGRIQMPSVIGMTTDQAISSLVAAGFNSNNIHINPTIVYSDSENGVVIAQNPQATSSGIIGITQTYDSNTQITLTVGQKEGI